MTLPTQMGSIACKYARARRALPPLAAQLHRRQMGGFTLVELMVTMAIVGILAGLAVPSFGTMIAQNRMVTQTNELVGMLNLAKSEAIKRGAAVRLAAISGTAIYSSSGVQVALSSGGTVIRTKPAFDGQTYVTRVTSASLATLSTASDLAYLEFSSRGGTTSGGDAFFRICDSGNASIVGRVIKVNQVGRIQLQSTTITCP